MKKFSKERLMRIGQEVASNWGAYCTNVKIKKNSVIFECNEYGEQFITKLTYERIEEKYGDVE